MQDDILRFEQRKQDHITFALQSRNQASDCNQLDHFQLIHEALPNLNFDEVSLTSERFGRVISNPFLVSSMTAGHAEAKTINTRLVEACQHKGWAMGVGSQRRELMEEDAAFEWKELRLNYPQVTLFGNLGIAQVISTPIAKILSLIESLQANALIIHCNALQECIQPEGTPEFKGWLAAIETLVSRLTIPVVIKETGCGFSYDTMNRLQNTGISALDISGLGGTHWGRIEGCRAEQDPVRQRAASTFSNWGIDTLSCMINARKLKPNYEIWGSGGLRHGLDAAKLLALGARTVGFAKPLLEATLQGSNALLTLMDTLEYELKVALFCTGSKTIADLREKTCL